MDRQIVPNVSRVAGVEEEKVDSWKTKESKMYKPLADKNTYLPKIIILVVLRMSHPPFCNIELIRALPTQQQTYR